MQHAQAAHLSRATGPITPVPPVRATPPVVSSRRLIVDLRENSGSTMRKSLDKAWQSIRDNTLSPHKLPVEPIDSMLASGKFVDPQYGRQRAFAARHLRGSPSRAPIGSNKAMIAAAAA